MSAVEVFFAVLAYIWLAYAGYRAWSGTASATARVIAVVLVGLLAIGLSQNLIEARTKNSRVQVGPYSAGDGVKRYAAVEVESSAVCVGLCDGTESNGVFHLRGNWIAGDYTLRPQGTQPYALSFKKGTADLDGKTLSPGCTSGQLSAEAKLQFGAASQIVLEIGPGVKCPS